MFRHEEQRVRALVVEDHPDAADVLVAFLKLLNCDAIGCHDGATCIELARKHEPHLILLDLAMPLMDGFAVAATLQHQALPPYLLVALSGYGDTKIKDRCKEAGFHRHVLKPIDPTQLNFLVEEARRFRSTSLEIGCYNFLEITVAKPVPSKSKRG